MIPHRTIAKETCPNCVDLFVEIQKLKVDNKRLMQHLEVIQAENCYLREHQAAEVISADQEEMAAIELKMEHVIEMDEELRLQDEYLDIEQDLFDMEQEMKVAYISSDDSAAKASEVQTNEVQANEVQANEVRTNEVQTNDVQTKDITKRESFCEVGNKSAR